MKKPIVHRIPITKARINLGQVARRVHLHRECFILEKDGIPIAGIINVDELEDYLEIQNPQLKQQIAEGYSEYRQGKGRNFNDFLTELKTSRPTKGSRKKPPRTNK